MIIGVPKEIKDHEYRVALTPSGAGLLSASGHRVIVQRGAGVGSGFSDDEYGKSGAHVVSDAADVFASSELVVKVKEPLSSEYPFLRPDLVLFTYLHLAPAPELASVLLQHKVTAI